MIGGDEPTFCDMTLVTAIAFGKFGPIKTDLTFRFEHLDRYWMRWKERESFKVSAGDVRRPSSSDLQRCYADGGRLKELEYLKTAKL